MVSITGDEIDFIFFRPGAKAVHLVGDFNGWRLGEMKMSPTTEGYWKARLKLPAGVYRFRYWADGRWFTDYAAFGIQEGPFGFDSILRVTAEQAEEPPQYVPSFSRVRAAARAPLV